MRSKIVSTLVALSLCAVGAFAADWTLQSDDPSLDLPGFVATSRINWHHADFNGDSIDDIVFAATAPPEYRQIVLDGATGAVLHVFEPISRPSSVGPILIDDRVDANGAPVSDGTLDILVHGSSYLEWLTPGSVTPVAMSTTGYFHSVSANGDLDGDGLDELFLGAPRRIVGEAFDAGALYVFPGHPNHAGLRPQQDTAAARFWWEASRDYLQTGGRFDVGDVNDDLEPDLLLVHRRQPG